MLVQQVLQRPREDPVEGSEEEAAVAAVAVAAPVLLEVRQGVHRADPVVLLVVVDLGVHHLAAPASLVVVTDPLGRTDYLLSPMVPVRVPVLASWGDPAEVASLDPLLVGIVGGVVVTMGQPLVETVLSTRWFLP